jgi:hypothetical protein
MRADTITFEDIFQSDRISGRISLGNSRYVMLDAAAVGNMRHELIENLGWEVTRGILERVGYQCGRHDAHQMRKHYTWDSDEEWLRAGIRLHYLEGIAKVHVNEWEFDRTLRKLHITGEWHDTFESEQHLQQYESGPSMDVEVCHVYDEFFGEDVLCLETHCRKGRSRLG